MEVLLKTQKKKFIRDWPVVTAVLFFFNGGEFDYPGTAATQQLYRWQPDAAVSTASCVWASPPSDSLYCSSTHSDTCTREKVRRGLGVMMWFIQVCPDFGVISFYLAQRFRFCGLES